MKYSSRCAYEAVRVRYGKYTLIILCAFFQQEALEVIENMKLSDTQQRRLKDLCENNKE